MGHCCGGLWIKCRMNIYSFIWNLVPLGLNHVICVFTLLQIITNGRYKSSVHRAVVNAELARLSVATFYDPSKSRKICTAPQLVSKDEPQKYRGVVYGDYVSTWYSKGPDGKRNIDALLIQQ